MKILLTGASSLTGHWFAKELKASGHTVTAALTAPPESYTGVRAQRVQALAGLAQIHHGIQFGDQAFLELLEQGWDVLAHHGAYVNNYRSPDFDAGQALACNTHNLARVVERLKSAGGQSIVLTGTVFEGGEGSDTTGYQDVSPYGLSKRLTYESFRYYCQRSGLPLQKFVIPNPFGPYEEPDKFTPYVMRSWLRGEVATCKAPALVRDNIHVGLLARAYVRCCEQGMSRLAPSGYLESQGRFLARMAEEVAGRIGRDCRFQLQDQAVLNEPYCRVNSDFFHDPEWSEADAWSDYVNYYRSLGG